MNRTTTTWLAAAAAVGIVTAGVTAALLASASGTLTPAQTREAFHESWNAMGDGERFDACLDVWEHGADDSAYWVDQYSDRDLHVPTIATELDQVCN